jgi:hypothetical protein
MSVRWRLRQSAFKAKDKTLSLGLNTGSSGGNFIPRISWDARAGRAFLANREQDAGGTWMSDKVDVTNDQPTFLADFGSVNVGYMAFTTTGPSFALSPLGQPFPAKPSDEHKQGVQIKFFSPKHFNGLREFSSSAKSVLGAIDALHSEYEAAPEAAAGKVPVVKLMGSTPIVTKGPSGNVTSYAPIFKIVSWAERVPEFGERTVPAPGVKANIGPTSKPTAHVAPPVAKKAEPVGGGVGAMADDEMPFAAEWR